MHPDCVVTCVMIIMLCSKLCIQFVYAGMARLGASGCPDNALRVPPRPHLNPPPPGNTRMWEIKEESIHTPSSEKNIKGHFFKCICQGALFGYSAFPKKEMRGGKYS